jgi:hypothetical protein
MNIEKYIDDILKITNCDFGFNKRDRKIIKCDTKYCKECLFNQENRKVDELSCNVAKLKWLISEYKQPPIKLTKLEYGILNHILNYTDYLYIARERDGALFIYKDKPLKTTYYWKGSDSNDFKYFNDLFQFIKWEDVKPTSIEELLKNCEVEEHESK